MSHPKRVDRFRQWSKDMIEGATVDRPRLTGAKTRAPRRKTSGSSRRRRKNAKKD